MKRTVIIAGAAMVMMLALTASLEAQRGMRSMRGVQDTARFRNMHRGDSLMPGAMRHRMGPQAFGNTMGPCALPHIGCQACPGCGRGMQPQPFGPGRDFAEGPGFGMRREMRPGMPGFHAGRPGRDFIESIPNLTDKQRKDISELRQKQLEEMKKLREEMAAKAGTLRESHREKIMNLLTDEQKKFMQGNKPAVQEKK